MSSRVAEEVAQERMEMMVGGAGGGEERSASKSCWMTSIVLGPLPPRRRIREDARNLESSSG